MRKVIAVVVALSALWASRCQSAEPVFNVRVIDSPAALKPGKPILTYYVGDPSWRCGPCDEMKRDLLKNPEELPFTVVVTSDRPAWVTFVPVAVWDTGHDGKRQLEGWMGRRVLVERYKRSLVPAATKPAASVAGGVVSGVGWHSHRCPFDGTIWRHDGTGPDHVASHRCPKCGRVQYEVHQ